MTISTPLVDVPLPTGFPMEFVARERLVRRLDAHVPVALVVAAAGHGKSTTVAEWAARDPRPTTWLSARDVPLDSRETLIAAAADVLLDARSLVIDDFDAVVAPDALAAVSE